MGSIVRIPNYWRTREVTKRICGHSGTMSIVFIQGFSKIATSLTAMLKTTGSSVVSAFRVDDDEVVGGGGGAGAESGGSVVERKVGSITPTKAFVKYADFTLSPDLASKLPEHTGINDHAIELVNNHPSHPIGCVHPKALT